jgi:hypothetical protein
MEILNLDKVVYQLAIEDLQNVATDCLQREFPQSEILVLEGKIGDHIDWFGAIQSAFIKNIKE